MRCFNLFSGDSARHLSDADGDDNRPVPSHRVPHPVHELEEYSRLHIRLSGGMER